MPISDTHTHTHATITNLDYSPACLRDTRVDVGVSVIECESSDSTAS